VCYEEKDRLLNLYKAGVANYSATVNGLNLTRGQTSQQEYNRLVSLSVDAWKSAESARFALERHTGKHDC
jgi:hypothetical protein